MEGKDDSEGGKDTRKGSGETAKRTGPQSLGATQETHEDVSTACLTKKRLIVICVAAALVAMVIIGTVTALMITRKSSPPTSFSPAGDMLDFLLQSGAISKHDGLMATWFHRANSKEDMDTALASDSMILEADVTLKGYGTANQTEVPIMAHPPDIDSDNTLDEWLDAVLASTKGVKLDFKSLASVGYSLDLLREKNNSRAINRPVWLNADILRGPNVPGFMPVVNGSRFLELIQEKFPDVTLSPGWMVAYAPPLFTGTYTRSMVEDMYEMIKDAPQQVTFPIHALLVQSGWQHISWLLSQSPRFSLTLWQGSTHPNISDLLFVRDNSHPARVYYDIYEPTLSQFKEAAKQQGRVRRFYPGRNLRDFLHPTHNSDTRFLSSETRVDRVDVVWFNVSNRTSLLARLAGGAGGMLVVQVSSDSSRPGVPVVHGSGKSSEILTLQDLLQLLQDRAGVPWAVYLRFHTQEILENSLKLLQSAYSREQLYRPVWISMEASQSTMHTQEFVSSVETLFPTSPWSFRSRAGLLVSLRCSQVCPREWLYT